MSPSRRLLLVWLVALVGLAAVVAGQLGPNRHRMEDDLTRRSARALAAAGAPAEIVFTGRDGVLRAADEATAARARDVVARLDGVRAVRTVITVQEAPVRPPAPELLAAVADGRITLTGTVPGQPGRDALHAAAAGRFAAVDDRIAVGDVAADGLAALPALLAALPPRASALRVHLRAGVLTLSGTAASETEWTTVTAAAARTGIRVVDQLTVADLGTQLADVPPLMFAPGSAWLTPQARRNLWRAAGLLHANPSATITVEGHTDSLEFDGGTLSRERAATVRDVLAEFGIDQNRMTVRGYGSSRPGAAEDSELGRAQNRHAALTVTGSRGP